MFNATIPPATLEAQLDEQESRAMRGLRFLFRKGRQMTLSARFFRLHGGEHGTYKWMADALQRSPEHVSKVLRGQRNQTAEWQAIAELLECIPREQWPARWHKKDAV